jgi:hypothetical protein
MPPYPSSEYPTADELADFKARFPDNQDIQGVDLETLIALIRNLDQSRDPPTSDYRQRSPRSISPCDEAIAVLLVEVVFVAFDFGSLPDVVQDN